MSVLTNKTKADLIHTIFSEVLVGFICDAHIRFPVVIAV